MPVTPNPKYSAAAPHYHLPLLNSSHQHTDAALNISALFVAMVYDIRVKFKAQHSCCYSNIVIRNVKIMQSYNHLPARKNQTYRNRKKNRFQILVENPCRDLEAR